MPYADPEKRKQYQKEYLAKRKAEDPEAFAEDARKRALKHRDRDVEKAQEQFRRWYYERGGKEHQLERQRTPEYKENARTRDLKRSFDLTPEQYQEMSEAQNGVCAICKRPDRKKALAVDHNHETGKVRGLLCNPCNRALGLFQDSADVLTTAADYLKENSI